MSGEADRPRHARGKETYGGTPSRSQVRRIAVMAGAGDSKRAPGKKDPARCKENQGGAHVPAITLDKAAAAYGAGCKWSVPWLPRENDEPRWHCRHEETCEKCGKVLRSWVEPVECPLFREATDEEKAVIAEALGRIRARPASRKPVITGPQGYRRRRED